MVPIEERFWPKVDKSGECWVWTGSTNGKYGTIGRGSRLAGIAYAHRVSWELANGAIPDGLDVCHHCDNPPCVRPDHLFLGTRSENMHDAARKGHMWRDITGARNPRASLTPTIAIAVRAACAAGARQVDVARSFGIGQSQVSRIVRRATWADR